MVEKLKNYRAELYAKRVALENTPINVEPEVAAYREKLIAQAEAEKAEKLVKYDNGLECIDAIIAREENSATLDIANVATV